MPPRQPIMPKRTAYYASEIREREKMEKGVNGLQVGLSNDLIRLKCISDHPSSFWKDCCLKKCWSMKALDKVLDTSDDA